MSRAMTVLVAIIAVFVLVDAGVAVKLIADRSSQAPAAAEHQAESAQEEDRAQQGQGERQGENDDQKAGSARESKEGSDD